MNDQPKPASEWTLERVSTIMVEEGYPGIVALHNAALAAARLEAQKQLAAERELLGQQIEATTAARLRASQAEQQLAAEQSKLRDAEILCADLQRNRDEIHQQLAAAVEAMRKAAVECSATHFVVAERILNAALAKVKP